MNVWEEAIRKYYPATVSQEVYKAYEQVLKIKGGAI
jgi:hypothetical protein